MTILEMQDRLGELHESSAALVQKSDDNSTSLSEEERALIASNTSEFDQLRQDIERRESIDAQAVHLSASKGRRTEPTGPLITTDAGTLDVADGATEARTRVHVQQASMRDNARWGWRSLGEQAGAIRQAASPGGKLDIRLEQRADPGAGTTGQTNVGSDGGFAIAPDFRNSINQIIESEDSMLSMADLMTTDSNSVTIPMDDTTPWQTTGGIQATWEGEAEVGTQSKPNLTQQNIRLNRLGVLVPVTEELMEDSSALTSWLTKKAPEKMQFAINLAIIQGSGAGQPLGILNSNCLVSIAKESGQVADTILQPNILKMHMRMYAPARRDSIWFINQDIEAQLNSMSFDYGVEIANVGKSVAPVYLPPGGLSQAPFGTLMGRPIFPTQACETLGDKGDIIFASMKQYLALTKGGGVRADTSIHLWFDFFMTAFRFEMRVGGQPWWGNTVSARDGSTTYSPFVTLDAR